MNKKINVYQISPKQSDITSYYRGLGPYGTLARQYSDLEVRYGEKLEIPNMFWCDVLVMQRPFTPDHHAWIQTLQQLGKPVIIDYDDDVTHVPSHNPHQKYYNTQDTQFSIKSSLNIAQAVQVSTEPLKAEFDQYNKNVIVVPNALDNGLFPDPKVNWERRRKLVLWRGGESHTNDLKTFHNEICNVVSSNPKWLFEFFGGEEAYMKYRLQPSLTSNTHFTKSQNMLQFVKSIRDMAPSVLIVPLADDKFNRAKSNIAWIEATMTGAVAVAPDMPDWQKPGVVTYSSKEDFQEKVNYLLAHPEELKANWEKSFEYIKTHLLLETVNQKRYDLIKSLV